MLPIDRKTADLIYGAVIAAIYVVLTYLAWGFDLASGAIQCRFSEALTVLPYVTPAAIPGVTAGCFLANLLMGSPLPDVLFGTLATLLGALGTRALRNNRWLCALPPVVSNAVIIPFVLRFAYGVPDMIPLLMLSVGAGELIACMLFGQILLSALLPLRHKLFPVEAPDGNG